MKNNLFEKLKELFNEDANDKETKFVDVETKEGKMLRVADVVVDQPVVEIVEGEEMPVDDGNYTLMDGTILVVQGGVILEVEAPAEEEEQQEEEMSEEKEETKKEKEEVKEELSEEENEIVSMISGLVDSVKELNSKFSAIEEENNELKEKVKKIGEAPSQDSVKKELFSSRKGTSPLHAIMENKK